MAGRSLGGLTLKLHWYRLYDTDQYCFFFKFYFIFKLYIIVLVLPNIKMSPPQVYMCSPHVYCFLICFQSYFIQVEKTSIFWMVYVLTHSVVVKNRTLELDCLGSSLASPLSS